MRFATRAELARWLAQHGLSHLERVSLEAAAPRLDPALWPRLASVASRRLLVELASDDVDVSWLPASLSGLFVAVARTLDDARVDASAARGEDRVRAPANPLAAEAHARLVAMRAQIPASVAPRTILAGLRHDPALPGFRFDDPLPYASKRGTFVRPSVELVLDPPRWSCTCGDDACVHALGAIDAALAWLHEPQPDVVLSELLRPAWQRTLLAIERVLDEEPTQGAVEVRFRLRVVDDLDVEVAAFVHRVGKSGLGAGRRVGKRALLLEHGGRLSPEDAKVVSLVPEQGFASRALLEALIAHPRLVLADDPERVVRIERAPVGLVAEQRGSAVRVTAGIEGSTLPSALLERVRRGRPDDVLFLWDSARLTLLDVQTELRALLRVLAQKGDLFPAEAQAPLIESLAKWALRMPVALPRGLMGESVPVDSTPLLRLTIEGTDVLVEVVVRPLPEGPTFAPGLGARDVHVRRVERPIHGVRDLKRERTLADALVESLPLRSATTLERTLSFVFEELQDVLTLLSACAERAQPPELLWVGTPLRIVGQARAATLKVEVVKKREWFGVLGGLSVAGERVELARLLDAARRKDRWVVTESKSYVEVTAALRAGLDPLLDHARRTTRGIEVSSAALPSLQMLAHAGAEVDADEAFRALAKRVESASTSAPVPPTLNATLRSYQVSGFEWLARLSAWGAGGILADDMGLGKTVQALALLLCRASEGPAIVVVPTSVAFNWVEEAQRFAPSLRMRLYSEAADRGALVAQLGPHDVLIVSYGLLARDVATLSRARFSTAVFDEAQNLKNPATRRARAARVLVADARFALSGTPIENHLGELWSLFSIVFPTLLGSWESYRERWALPIERGLDREAGPSLVRVVAPFLLRRTKDRVETELPSRTEVRVPVVLSTAEWDMYEDARLSMLSDLETRRSVLREQERRVEVLAALTRLRLLASHPRLYDKNTTVPSSKLERLLALVDELRLEGQRALVFSQFTSHLSLVRAALDARGIAYEYLDGSTPVKQRGQVVRTFQEGTMPLFLVSLKAGGSGLNLTAATNVIHLDPWWNPAVEDQASDRAHRLGQTRPVTIYRLVALGTIEEKMVELHAHKRALVDLVLGDTERQATVSTQALVDLLSAGRPPLTE